MRAYSPNAQNQMITFAQKLLIHVRMHGHCGVTLRRLPLTELFHDGLGERQEAGHHDGHRGHSPGQSSESMNLPVLHA